MEEAISILRRNSTFCACAREYAANRIRIHSVAYRRLMFSYHPETIRSAGVEFRTILSGRLKC